MKHRMIDPLFLFSALAVLATAFSCKTKDLDTTRAEPVIPVTEIRLPTGEILAPAGHLVPLPGMRPQVLALHPSGRILAVSGKTHEVVIVDPKTGVVLQRVPLPPENDESPDAPGPVSMSILEPDEKGQVSYTGMAFSPEGSLLYMSNVNGSVKVFKVGEDLAVQGLRSIPMPPANAPRRSEEIPAGLALSADGSRLYVALNLSNRLGEFDASTGALLRLFDVGVAPFDVVLAKGKAFVSNWGGSRPEEGDLTGPAGRGTRVKVDPERHVACEGSVTVIDLANGSSSEVRTGRHASALALSPDERFLVCANAAEDTLSVLDTTTAAVRETICAKPSPADLFGASPNALAFTPEGDLLFAANGTQNAVAVIRFRPEERASRLEGLIPVGWFPGAVVFHPSLRALCVANIKGLPLEKGTDRTSGGRGFNTHQYTGSISLVPLPEEEDLPALSAAVWANDHRGRIERAFLPPRSGEPPRPVPERIGEPSVFKHVIYIIKENRTYDQVLGDEPRGNGDPSLCIFGEEVTPNQHKIVQDFVLLDNAYCCGILSADGHQWSTSAFGTDYLERSFAGWPRSYPDGMGENEIDALAYAPTGFLWDNALSHGKRLRDWGEFTIHTVRWADQEREGEPDWTACWRERLEPRGEVLFGSRPAIASLAGQISAETVGWNMNVPDQFRADQFIRELSEFERQGNFPDLALICLPDDHTSGTHEGAPTPQACVADNDLALGRIVEAVGKSRFWKETVIFAVEDDPQNGWDHVSGYRTTAYVVSPYTKRGVVSSTFYNTVSILRTIEQILGLPPMNQFDAAAEPMFDLFTDEPDFKPFVAVPNRIPLDRMNPSPASIADPLLRDHAELSARLDFSMVDACPEDVLNRILWHAVKGPDVPYPEWAVRSYAEQEDD